MLREPSLNPIFLMGQSSTSSLYHSFFLLDIGDTSETQLCFRFPSDRRELDDVESGVKYFVGELVRGLVCQEDRYGSFVVTSSGGSRYFAFWRGSFPLIFVAVSRFPLTSFSRGMFSLLSEESTESLPHVMNAFCEFPIIGTAGACYEVRMSAGILPLHFNRLGMLDDADMYSISLRLLSPRMMVDAWEVLMLEYKVLVMSSCREVISHCCEFLRHIVAPLEVVNTYVPLLPVSLLNTIEAPFPYLVGAQTDDVLSNAIDISDTVVIDLDEQCVRMPSNESASANDMAPQFLKMQLVKDINSVILNDLSAWTSRPSSNSIEEGSYDLPIRHPMSSKVQEEQAMKICEIFVRQNLTLLGARHCDVRAFYRQCDRPYYRTPEGDSFSKDSFFRMSIPKHRDADGRVSSMGFSIRSGVYCGCMQLLNEKKDIDILQFLPCWVELDKERLAVHEFADEMPLISVLSKSIVAVSPSAAEPEGHVFDVQMGSQMTYRFAATDPDSRREWIRVIEGMTTKDTPNVVPLHQISESSINQSTQSIALINDVDLPPEPQHLGDDDQLNVFRVHVGHTQMVSFYKSSCDFIDYEAILTGPEHKLQSSTVLTSGCVVAEETDEQFMPVTPVVSLLRKQGSSQVRESDTELCSPAFLKDLSNLWRLFISGEITEEELSEELPAITSPESKPNAPKWLRQSSEYLRQSYMFLGKEGRDYSKQRETLRLSASALADIASNVEKERGFLTNLFFRNSPREDQKKEERGASSRKIANNIIKTEINLRNAASELIQRLASAHRQCEADLRKMIVNEKMFCTANMIDCSCSHSDTLWKTIVLDIADVSNSSRKQEDLGTTWIDTLKEWTSIFSYSGSSRDIEEASKDLRNKIEASIKRDIDERKRGRYVHDPEGEDKANPSHIVVPLLESMNAYTCRQSKNEYTTADQRKLVSVYGKGSLMDQRRLMRCLLAIFLDLSNFVPSSIASPTRKADNDDTPPPPPPPLASVASHQRIKEFLYWAVGINDIIGLQAIRLVTELMHTCLTGRMGERIADQGSALSISSNSGEFDREVAYGVYSRKRVSISNMQPTFNWANSTEAAPGAVREKSQVLNEAVICKSTASKACELSVQLLSSLREILRAASAAGALNNERRIQPGNSLCMVLTEEQREEISNSSAFRSFEIQSCQVQMVDVDGMDDNAKAVFFCNIFNVMTIHAVMMKIPSGTSFYEKYNFMRSTKYNISGMVLSLLDIEHNILRAQTSSPYSIFGPVSIKTSSFSEKDSRSGLLLKKPFPLVSFILFTATASSPPLTTLWDPSTVKQEMRRCTSLYLQDYIQVDMKNKVVLVPEQFRWYWKDFGGAKMKVLNTVIHLCSETRVATEIGELLKITQKPRISFINYDWNFVLKL